MAEELVLLLFLQYRPPQQCVKANNFIVYVLRVFVAALLNKSRALTIVRQ
jgi:hypothetical protein